MPSLKEPDAEPIPGYRLIEFLGRGGFGEVWKCEAPGGVFKAIKFVQGDQKSLDTGDPEAGQEWKALQLVKTIRHPFLLGIDRLEQVDGEIVVVLELADGSLAEKFRDHRAAGRPGIPRAELLAYLREAAEALDVINLEHRLQHLDVKPANLFLVNRHVKVGDFGLVNCLGDETGGPGDAPLGGLTPLYCAPETLTGKVSSRCDQYSLAIVYQELLTGQPPFVGGSPREVMLRRMTGAPNLTPLPPEDWPVVERALARDPEARYPSCTDFIRALAPEGMSANFSPSLDRLLTEKGVVGPGARDGRLAAQTAPTLTTCHSAGDTESFAPARPDFAGYRLIGSQKRNPLCEVWNVTAPDGRGRLLTFYSGLTDGSHASEAKVLQLLSSLSHRHLLPVELLRNETGRIGVVCDPKDGKVADWLEQCRGQGKPGITRREVLDYLYGVADALDAVYRDHHLQHLMLSLNALVRDRKRLLIADMGLAQLVWLPAGQPVGRLNGRYSAPELWSGEVSPTCDQYSLAVILYEMLTGASPVRGRGAHGKTPLFLDHLPAPDREPIARALNADPKRRFGTCSELIEALDRPLAPCAPPPAVAAAPIVLPPVISVREKSLAPASGVTLPPAQELIGLMLDRVTGPFQYQQTEKFSYLLRPGTLLRHTCGAVVPADMVGRKLEGFRLQWKAEIASKDPKEFWLEVPITNSFWQRCMGKRPAILIQISLGTQQLMIETLTGVRVEMRPMECEPEQALVALGQYGPLLLEGLRNCLGAVPDRRGQARLPFEHRLGVFPVLGERRLGDAVLCEGMDVLPSGIGLIAPTSLPTEHVYLQPLLTPQLSALAVLGRVVRTQRRADGRCVVGLTFARGPQTLLCPPGSENAGPQPAG